MNNTNVNTSKRKQAPVLSDLSFFSIAFVGIVVLTLTFSQQALAADTQQARTTSVGKSKLINAETEITSAKFTSTKPANNKPVVDAIKLSIDEKKGKTRADIQALKQVHALNANSSSPVNYYYSFSIYNAFSTLLDDVDLDGYYQTFSVIFDVDLHSNSTINQADVYAELYISKNGGPWEYYFTSDDFSIYGDSTTDEYEVTTTLHQGYASNEYDILIDIYEVGYSGIVATINADDVNGLYALPLESAEFDLPYQVQVIESHGSGGSWSVISLFIMMIIAQKRKNKMLSSVNKTS